MRKIHLEIDDLISKRELTESKTLKRNYTRIIIKLRRRIQNLQTELHYKLSVWLTDHFDNIIIPKFGSKNMVKKSNRKIGKVTVREMMTLAHGKFLEKLKNKAESKGVNVIIVDEKYTTMTCGRCHRRKYNIKAAKEWICNNCSWHHGRDSNAARNIGFKVHKVY